MGYYTEYFSTLLKSNWALATKERWDSRRVVRYSRVADKLIYKELPDKIEIEHKVTQALKDESKAIDAINHVIKYGLQLAFNSSYEDEIILRAIKHLVENMELIHQILNTYETDFVRLGSGRGTRKRPGDVDMVEPQLEAISKKFVLMIRNQTQKAEGQEREEMKDVMNLITQSHKFDSDDFMTAVKQKFSTINSQTILARYAFRFDIQHEKRLINALERLSIELEVIKKQFERISTDMRIGAQKSYVIKPQLPQVVQKFKHIVDESEKDIEGAFLYSYKIKKRDFNMMLTMMVNADILKKLNLKWIRMHFMPATPTEARIKDIENLEKKLGEKIHVVAQALRIEINAQEDIAKKALPILS